MKGCLFALIGLLLSAPAFAGDRAVVREEIIEIDEFGNEDVIGVREPGAEEEQAIPGPEGAQYRGFNAVEREELRRLEFDFQMGKITESEYNARKLSIQRGARIKGTGPDPVGHYEW